MAHGPSLRRNCAVSSADDKPHLIWRLAGRRTSTIDTWKRVCACYARRDDVEYHQALSISVW